MREIGRQDYNLAFTHLKNNQNISAHNLFTNLAETQKKTDKVKAALLFLLAAECKSKQNKEIFQQSKKVSTSNYGSFKTHYNYRRQ